MIFAVVLAPNAILFLIFLFVSINCLSPAPTEAASFVLRDNE